MTQSAHIPVYSNTRPHQAICVVVLSKASSNQTFLADGTYSFIAFVPLQILIAFEPNSTYTFSVPSATRGVSQFFRKKRENKFEFIQHILDLAIKIALDVFTLRFPSESCPYAQRTGHGSNILLMVSKVTLYANLCCCMSSHAFLVCFKN